MQKKKLALVSLFVISITANAFLLFCVLNGLSPQDIFTKTVKFPTGTFFHNDVRVEFKPDGTARWYSIKENWSVPVKYGINKDLYTEMAFNYPGGVKVPATYYWKYENGQLVFTLWGEDFRSHRKEVMNNVVYEPLK